MIEIIREEEWEHTQEKSLPKDIRQMGRPDIGDRIYVEDQVYHFLHPYDNPDEKTAYVLLGRFENYSGRQCTFVEAAVRLDEVAFEGELPLWNDNTWAYIYKQLKREYDSMIIVGWAMDIKGQLAGMTPRIEALHQSNFGGAHQVLFLMDSLEKEEAFYGIRSGRMSRREGFYIYYDKNQQAGHRQSIPEEIPEESAVPEEENEWERQAEERAARKSTAEKEKQSEQEERPKREKWIKGEFGERFFRENSPAQSGNYRKQVIAQEERRGASSYGTTLVLLAVVCVLGIAAYTNNQKMNAMEATLAQMNGGGTMATERTESQEPDGVIVETVEGNVTKQENTSEEQTAENDTVTNGEESAQTNGSGAVTENAATSVTGTTTADGNAVANGSEATTTEGTGTPNPETGTDAAGTTDQTAGIGSGTATAADPAMTEAQTYLAQGYYIVQKGDTLVSICKKIYQTTAMMDKLCDTNDIEDQDAIYAGQKLILPN